MLQHYNNKLNRNEEGFQWTQSGFLTYIMEATYWQKMELIGYMLSFFDN